MDTAGYLVFELTIISIAFQNDTLQVYIQITKSLGPMHDIKVQHGLIAKYTKH